MWTAENFREACTKKKDVEIAFARCFQAYDEYYQFVDVPEVKSVALNAYIRLCRGTQMILFLLIICVRLQCVLEENIQTRTMMTNRALF